MKKENFTKRKFGNKRNRKPEDTKCNRVPRGDKSEKEITHKFNDVSWYTKNDQMLRDAASYSYNAALGSPIPWDLLVSGPVNMEPVISSTSGNAGIPGLMSFHVLPTIGISKDASSPANIAAQNIYSYVRYMNSGAKNYDQADLMLYLLAMDSVYSCWNWLKRIYGYLRTYSQYNKYMPRAYAYADVGIEMNFNRMISGLADFRLFLNQAAAKISSFCVPAVMPYFIRHSWMFSNIYKDSDSQKAQQYMFVPKAFYKYAETASQYGGELQPVLVPQWGEVTLGNLQDILLSLINAIAYSEDIGVMSGDILKAYGDNKLFKLTPVDAEYQVLPVYNEEVLNQMHNSTIAQVSSTLSDASYKITQDPNTGFLIWNPTLNSMSFPNKGAMINMPWDDVTPANTMVGTRLTALQEGSKLIACGSEIVTHRSIFTMYANGGIRRSVYDTQALWMNVTTEDVDVKSRWAIARDLIRITKFDWHPLIPVVVPVKHDDGSIIHYFVGIAGDVSNYTMMSSKDLDKLHYTAIMSEFNIPQLGSF